MLSISILRGRGPQCSSDSVLYDPVPKAPSVLPTCILSLNVPGSNPTGNKHWHKIEINPGMLVRKLLVPCAELVVFICLHTDSPPPNCIDRGLYSCYRAKQGSKRNQSHSTRCIYFWMPTWWQAWWISNYVGMNLYKNNIISTTVGNDCDKIGVRQIWKYSDLTPYFSERFRSVC